VWFTKKEQFILYVLIGTFCIGSGLVFAKRWRANQRLKSFNKEYAVLDSLIELSSDSARQQSSSLQKDKRNFSSKTLTIKNKININTAYAKELKRLPGIGEVLAERIVTYRDTHGLFQSYDELLNIRGIGQKTLEKITPYISKDSQ